MNFDESIYKDFIDESNELLASIEDDILYLEKNKIIDTDIINKIFRAVHTVKGSSGLLQLSELNTVAHTIETIFDKIRKNEINIAEIDFDNILILFDNLKSLINSNSQTTETTCLLNTNEISNSEKNNNIKNKIDDNLNDVLDIETEEYFENSIRISITEVKELLASIHNEIPKNNLIRIYRILQSLFIVSHSTNYFNIHKTIELLIKIFRTNILNGNDKNIDYLIEFEDVFDFLQVLVDDINYSNNIKNEQINNIFEHYNISNDVPKTNQEIEPNISKSDELKTETQTSISNIEKSKNETIRINIDILDKLMSYAGELVLIRNRQLKTFIENENYNSLTQNLDTLTSKIHETIMQTRLQPIGNVFNKFPRIVRDLSKKLDKEINIEINGDEVEIDKTYIEILTSPLVHLIRNSIDHGIENEKERIKKNKNPIGKIILNATYNSGYIIISIIDDGCGIDIKKIAEKAIENKLKNNDEISKMSENDILELIFYPGFSTAYEITDVSGRGVGLDAVKSLVESYGGTVEVYTNIGTGTEFRLNLPFTLAIMPALIIENFNEKFAIPQINIIELIKIYSTDFENKIVISGENIFLYNRNEIIPLIIFDNILNYKEITKATKIKFSEEFSNTNHQFPINIIILKSGKKVFGLIVNQIIETEEIVIKPVHEFYQNFKIYSGTTILGDGSVVLILDIEGIINHDGISNFKKNLIIKDNTENSETIEQFLIYKFGVNENFAFPVNELKHIYEIKNTEIEFINERKFIKIEEKIYQIISINDYLNISNFTENEIGFILIPKNNSDNLCFWVNHITDIEHVSYKLETETIKSEYLKGSFIFDNKIILLPDYDKIITKTLKENSITTTI